MTEDEKRGFVVDWIKDAASRVEFVDVAEKLSEEYGIDDDGETARNILDLMSAARIEVTW